MPNLPQHPHKLSATEIRQLVGRDDPLILEIGCHDGSDTAKFQDAMPGAVLHCFEPYAQPRGRFWDNVTKTDRIHLYEYAICDSDEPQPFYASTGKAGHSDDWDYSGSLRRPTGHLKRSPEIGFHQPIKVPCHRLDTWLKETRLDGRIIDFIWADVQASEGDMIIGGQRALNQTRYLYTEFYDYPLYEGQLNLKQLHGLLLGHTQNWELLGIYVGENALFRNMEPY